MSRFRIRNFSCFQRTVKTRFPFRFGKSSMTEMPILTLRLRLELENGTEFEGYSSSGIPPLWFDKRSGKTPQDNHRDLLHALKISAEAYQLSGSNQAYGFHTQHLQNIRKNLMQDGMAGLAAGFGPALLDAACVDGLCRQFQTPFHLALRSGVLGVPSELLEGLGEPLPFIHLRHTIGLADALIDSDIQNPLNDGLPESLEQVIRFTKARYFKVKISADAMESTHRLLQIAEILDRMAGDYSVTLDGNEQFETMESFADFLEKVRGLAKLSRFWQRVLWIEQPVLRDTALQIQSASVLKNISAFKPVIIDESDGEEDALKQALALGYSGVSSKTCKGLFRSLAHHAQLRQASLQSGRPHIHSSEDLTTVPVLPLQQDLCLVAALGIPHTERNGHHYIRGFEFLSDEESENALTHYPSLYASSANGTHVRIQDGGFHLTEVNTALGLGSHSIPDWKSMREIDFSSNASRSLQ